MPATTKKNVDPSHTIEYQRTVINDMAGDLQSLFVGTAAINAATIQVAGADIGAISDHDDKTIFFYYGRFDADHTVGSPEKVAEILSHEDATVDIDDGVTVTVDSGCSLAVTDTTKYEFFSTTVEETNPQKLVGFADNIRTSIVEDTSLTGKIKVGYTVVPSYLQAVPLQLYTPTGAVYNHSNGELIITIGTHQVKDGDTIKIQTGGLTFTCAKDSHATNHNYPRPTDTVAYNKKLIVTNVTDTSITINVGTPAVGDQYAHTFVKASHACISHGGEQLDDVAIEVDDTFTLSIDEGAVLIV